MDNIIDLNKARMERDRAKSEAHLGYELLNENAILEHGQIDKKTFDDAKWWIVPNFVDDSDWPNKPPFVIVFYGVSGFAPIPANVMPSSADVIAQNAINGHAPNSAPVAGVCVEHNAWDYFDRLLAAAPTTDDFFSSEPLNFTPEFDALISEIFNNEIS